MTIDQEILSYPNDTIFEVYWKAGKNNRTQPYFFQKVNDDEYDLIELKGADGGWKNGDQTPNWERDGRPDMFRDNHAVEVVNHGVRQKWQQR